MNHFRSSLSNLSALAVALGLAACGGRQSQATAPQGAYAEPQGTAAPEQYGAAMGQPAPGPTGETAPSTGAMTPEQQGQYGTQGQPGQGQPGGQGQYGTQQGMPSGSQYGGQGAQGGAQPGAATGTGPQTGAGGMPGMTGGAPGTMGATSGMGQMDVSTLNDAQLAAVLDAMNGGEIQTAQLAESRAASPDVKRFAHMMATDHRQTVAKTQALFSRLQITPSDNAVSQQMQSDTQNHLATLQSMRGKDFDREYIDQEIQHHNQAIEMIDRMIPNAKNPDLKAELQTLRGKLEGHLREAERTQAMLQRGSTNQQGAPPSGTQPPQY